MLLSNFVPCVGGNVYFYSVKLDEYIEGRVEGFYTEDLSSVLPYLDDMLKKRFELYSKLSIPNIIPDAIRSTNSNYEYVITLKESEELNFCGYNLDIVKLNNGKKIQDINSLEINLHNYNKSLS